MPEEETNLREKWFREKVDAFALKHDLRIEETNYWNVVESNFCCPCRPSEDEPCPCKYALQEIEENGHCMCMLFWKK